MTFKKFTLGLVVAFGLPWTLLVVVPFAKTRQPEAIAYDEDADGREGIYGPKRAGRVSNGSEIYGANGCYVCHTQVIRPTYAGSEIWRDDWAGQKKNADDKDTRRESNLWDYEGEAIAHIGLTRVGPDLSNVGYRLEKKAQLLGMKVEDYIYTRLLNPRSLLGNHWSTCPSNPQFFDKPNYYSQSTNHYKNRDGECKIPNQSAKTLASYLKSLKKDEQVPRVINYRR